MSERQAGRELDAEIARIVFGRTIEMRTIRSVRGNRQEPRGPLPAYSTDIAAAWQVVEKFKAEHHHFDVQVAFDLSGNAVGYNARAANARKVGAATAPLAICLAALAATHTDTEG